MKPVKTSVTEKVFDRIENKLPPLSDVNLQDARRVAAWYEARRALLIKELDIYFSTKTFGAFLLGAIITIIVFFIFKLF